MNNRNNAINMTVNIKRTRSLENVKPSVWKTDDRLFHESFGQRRIASVVAWRNTATKEEVCTCTLKVGTARRVEDA